MDTSGGAGESSGIFEKIFWVQFQFTKDTRYNKGMEHMEHFYKDDSSIFTHTIWVILSLNCFETFCKISKADIICSPEKGYFFDETYDRNDFKSVEAVLSLEVFEVFVVHLECNLVCTMVCIFRALI